jgi:hypothetical protein
MSALLFYASYALLQVACSSGLRPPERQLVFGHKINMRQKPVAELGDGNNAPMMSVGLAMPESIRRNGHSKFEDTVKPTY